MLNNKSLILLSFAALVAISYAKNLVNVDIGTESYIVNGEEAAPGQFPFYVLLISHLFDRNGSYCGGTLINNQWILTAAHCVTFVDAYIDRFEIHLGATNLTDRTEEGRVIVSTKNSFPHPYYASHLLQNDIALLKLENPVEFSETIQAVNLTEKATLEAGTKVTAVGFGKLTTSDKRISSTLQFAELYHISQEQCSRTYPFLANREDVICTRGVNSESTCHGDSGGPLVFYENGTPTLIGTTSFVSGPGCDFNYPAGFSKTSAFLEWIEETIAEN